MSVTNDFIQTSNEAGVMTIRMNRADKKNALTGDMYARMAAALDEANSNNNIHSVLLLGATGSFTAGNDISDFMKIAMSGERSSMAVFDFLERIIMAPKPIVAGVDGLAIGIGTTMLLHCDYVVASDASLFKTPFVDLGLVPEAGSSLIVPELTGYHRAFSLLVLGEALSSQDAKDAGFVNKIVASDVLEEAASACAAELASKPQQSLKLTRDLVRGDRTPILNRMREEAVIFGERLQSDEARDAFQAFMAKGMKKAS